MEKHQVDIQKYLLPVQPHHGPVTTYFLTRAAILYVATIGLSSAGWLLVRSESARIAALGLLFPGAGFLGLSDWWPLLAVLWIALWPVAFFCWFGAGMLAAPVGIWVFGDIIALALALRDPSRVSSSAYPLYGALCLIAVLAVYITGSAQRRMRKEAKDREIRNAYLRETMPQAVLRAAAANRETPPQRERELTLGHVQALRYYIDLLHQAKDDWTNFTIVDQFQPAALRYQFYNMNYLLGFVHGTYMPSFTGYMSSAERNSIEKTLVPKCMSYWKWESLWGKFTTDYDPVTIDNIMFTGWYLLAVMSYQLATGDTRYGEKDSLKVEVTERDVYYHSVHTLAEALVSNFNRSAYCLYPCEPNWIYTTCNTNGMNGLIAYDAFYGTSYASDLYTKFRSNFISEFTMANGKVVPIRSAILGITIPGISGALSDGTTSYQASACLPDIAFRTWELTKYEAITYDSEAKTVEVKGVGADMIDAGNYKPSTFTRFGMLLAPAREYGDYELADALESRADKECGYRVDDEGNVHMDISLAMRTWYDMAKMTKAGDYNRYFTRALPKDLHTGPMLTEVPYPKVLVASAFSTGENLHVVAYSGSKAAEGTEQPFDFSQLRPGRAYSLNGEKPFKADAQGRARAHVKLVGRTAIDIVAV